MRKYLFLFICVFLFGIMVWWWQCVWSPLSPSPETIWGNDPMAWSGVVVIDGMEVRDGERMDVTHIFGDTALGGSEGARIEIDGYGQMYYFIDDIDGDSGHVPDTTGDYTWRDENGQVYTVIHSDEEWNGAYE